MVSWFLSWYLVTRKLIPSGLSSRLGTKASNASAMFSYSNCRLENTMLITSMLNGSISVGKLLLFVFHYLFVSSSIILFIFKLSSFIFFSFFIHSSFFFFNYDISWVMISIMCWSLRWASRDWGLNTDSWLNFVWKLLWSR